MKLIRHRGHRRLNGRGLVVFGLRSGGYSSAERDIQEIADATGGRTLTSHAALSSPALQCTPVNGRSTCPGEAPNRAIGSIASRRGCSRGARRSRSPELIRGMMEPRFGARPLGRFGGSVRAPRVRHYSRSDSPVFSTASVQNIRLSPYSPLCTFRPVRWDRTRPCPHPHPQSRWCTWQKRDH